ncbi:MAG: hypothetical protein ACKOW9_05155 [Candidatus Paceibacterota bacterium]
MKIKFTALVVAIMLPAAFFIYSISNDYKTMTGIAEKRIKECINLNTNQERYDCGKLFLESYYKIADSKVLNNALKSAVLASGREGASMCHPLSEKIGSLTSISLGEQALNYLEYSCLGGFVHGVFYRLGLQYSGGEIAAMSVGVCEEFAKDKPWVAGWDCRHGVGHAISEDIKLSVDEMRLLCTTVYSAVGDQLDCFTGVIGGVVERLVQPNPDILGLPSKPWEWCNKLAGNFRSACMQRSGNLASTYYTSFDEIKSICDADDKDCVYGLGFYFGSVSLDLSPEERAEHCLSLGGLNVLPCISGLMRNITPEYWLLELDPGVCKHFSDELQYCLQEQNLVRERELTLSQIYNRESYKFNMVDPAAWPLSERVS